MNKNLEILKNLEKENSLDLLVESQDNSKTSNDKKPSKRLSQSSSDGELINVISGCEAEERQDKMKDLAKIDQNLRD